jgi:hypothetical protein
MAPARLGTPSNCVFRLTFAQALCVLEAGP